MNSVMKILSVVVVLAASVCVANLVLAQQGPGYTTDQLEFKSDDIGNKWARLKGSGDDWTPVLINGQRPATTSVIGMSTTGLIDPKLVPGHKDPLPLPKTPKPGVAGRPAEPKKATAQDQIKRLAAAPKAPNGNNGGKERWAYSEERIDELNRRLDAMESALNDIVKLLEKKTATP